MKLDTFLPPYLSLRQIPEFARAVEALGFDGVWMAETQHNPFLACTQIAANTERIEFGTGIAISFARSPAVMAHTAWDLSDFSGGRFILGLGTQVKAHIERRFGMLWPDSPVGKQREQIQAIRAFWRNWQEGERLNQRGEYYKLTLTSPFFTPAKIQHPDIPIYIAGVNTGLARLAGEVADGFHVHPLNTRRYLQEVMLPALEEGAAKAGRARQEVNIVVNAFVVANETDREMTRQQISFYASTPSYRKVLAQHGWEEIGEQLSHLASRQQWSEMPALVSDEMIETIAVVAEPGDLAEAIEERYNGIADRLTAYIPFMPGERDALWQELRKGFDVA
jgi:probable F420-dependent oxidoreductase